MAWLTTTSSHDHTFSILAFDQRGNYHKILPAGTSHAQATEIKREVVSVLSPYVRAALATADGSGLLMALEKTGYSGDASVRGVDFVDGWTVAKIKRMGASAVKLLVYYHPDTGSVADEIEEVIRGVAAACIEYDLPLFVEPLSYSHDQVAAQLPDCRQVDQDTEQRHTGFHLLISGESNPQLCNS